MGEPREPTSSRWAIRIAGAASAGVVVAGEVVIAEICDPVTRIGAAFRYLGGGGGVGIGEARIPSPPGGLSGASNWEHFTLPRPIPLSGFEGGGSVTAAGLGVGGHGVGSTVLIFSNPGRLTGRNVNVEFSGAPLMGAGFTATTGNWTMSSLYPMRQ
jgi:hypothetical protein